MREPPRPPHCCSRTWKENLWRSEGEERGRDGGKEGRREGDEGLMHILCLNVSYEFMKNHLYKYYEKKEERKEEKERNKQTYHTHG